MFTFHTKQFSLHTETEIDMWLNSFCDGKPAGSHGFPNVVGYVSVGGCVIITISIWEVK